MPVDRASVEGLLSAVDIREQVENGLKAGIPRLDPKTRETVASNISLRIRLALLKVADEYDKYLGPDVVHGSVAQRREGGR